MLSAEDVEALVDGYRAGATVYDLATRFGINRTTVSQHLRRSGVRMRRQGLEQDQVATAARLYEQGQSLSKVGACVGVDAGTVRQALITCGVRMRAPWERA
jgi:DNA-binding transcriptional ArsR family regulator